MRYEDAEVDTAVDRAEERVVRNGLVCELELLELVCERYAERLRTAEDADETMAKIWERAGEEIKKALQGMPEGESEEGAAPKPKVDEGPYPATGRHNITNIVLKIDGDKAVGRAYWFHYGNTNPERAAQLDSYGYYEDEMVKVDGQWLFSKRVIYNEQVKEWIGSDQNPAW